MDADLKAGDRRQTQAYDAQELIGPEQAIYNVKRVVRGELQERPAEIWGLREDNPRVPVSSCGVLSKIEI